MAFSHDGDHLNTGGSSRAVQVWDARTGHEVGTLGTHDREIRGAGCQRRRTGTWLRRAPDGTVKLWDATRLRGTSKWRAARHPRARVGCSNGCEPRVLSPDGHRLAGAGVAYRVRSWDVPTGRELQILRRYSGDVWAAAFSFLTQPAGGSSRRGGYAVKVWGWPDRHATPQRPRPHAVFITNLAFSPDGRLAGFGKPGSDRESLGFVALGEEESQSVQAAAAR